MNLIDKARLTDEENERACSTYYPCRKGADAQLAKAIWAVVDWLPEWMKEHHPEDECGGECVCTRNHFVQGLLDALRKELKVAGLQRPKE